MMRLLTHHLLARPTHQSAPRSRLVWLHVLMAMLLVFAQSEATLHWLEHATVAATAKHDVLSADGVCEQCLAFSSLDHAMHVPAVAAAVAAVLVLYEPACRIVSFLSPLQLGYASRGPPLS